MFELLLWMIALHFRLSSYFPWLTKEEICSLYFSSWSQSLLIWKHLTRGGGWSERISKCVSSVTFDMLQGRNCLIRSSFIRRENVGIMMFQLTKILSLTQVAC